jgi:hypothetical protein
VPTDDRSGVAISYSLICGGAASKVTLLAWRCKECPLGTSCSTRDDSTDQIPVSGSKLLLNLDGDRDDLVGDIWSLLGVRGVPGTGGIVVGDGVSCSMGEALAAKLRLK